jgi:hypothetical protein
MEPYTHCLGVCPCRCPPPHPSLPFWVFERTAQAKLLFLTPGAPTETLGPDALALLPGPLSPCLWK